MMAVNFLEPSPGMGLKTWRFMMKTAMAGLMRMILFMEN